MKCIKYVFFKLILCHEDIDLCCYIYIYICRCKRIGELPCHIIFYLFDVKCCQRCYILVSYSPENNSEYRLFFPKREVCYSDGLWCEERNTGTRSRAIELHLLLCKLLLWNWFLRYINLLSRDNDGPNIFMKVMKFAVL